MPINTKTTELTEETNPLFSDIIDMVKDPAGTPLDRYTKRLNFVGFDANPQTGTTYTVLTDDFHKIVTQSNGSASAYTLPQAGASFPDKWFFIFLNLGAGTATITPTTSTINGAASMAFAEGEGAIIVSDGTNYTALKFIANASAGSIADDSVTNAKLANMATQTIKGRTTAGTGDPEDLTATQATAILNALVGDSGSGGTKGLAPAPAAGDAAAGKFLKADGTWAAPGGVGGSPGGSNGDIQYRVDASTFGGSPLKRIDANTIEQKNTTTTQVFRLYKTDDGAGNYERIALQVASNVFILASEKGGTGSVRHFGIKVDSSLYEFGTASLSPPTDGGQQLGTTSLRWAQFNGNNINIANGAEFRWNTLTRLTAGVDGFPIIIADAGIASNCGWIFGRNDTNGVRLRRVSTVLETRLGGDSDYATHVAGGFRCGERAADPSAADLTSGANAKDRVQMYMKNDKLVFAYNAAGTVTYVSIPLDGSTTTWTHSTSAP